MAKKTSKNDRRIQVSVDAQTFRTIDEIQKSTPEIESRSRR